MSFSLVPLLLNSQDIPAGAREALHIASETPPEQRIPLLESAARILHRESAVDCADARELVGLSGPGSCS